MPGKGLCTISYFVKLYLISATLIERMFLFFHLWTQSCSSEVNPSNIIKIKSKSFEQMCDFHKSLMIWNTCHNTLLCIHYDYIRLCLKSESCVCEGTSTSVVCWKCWISFMTPLRLFLMESMDSFWAAEIFLTWEHNAACLALMAFRFSSINAGFSCGHSVNH